MERNELRPGDLFGRYEIIRELGRGGMGVVYKAWQGDLKRFVALKVLLDEESLPPEDIKRFEREARSIAGLRHPAITPIHEVGVEAGRHFFAMEFLEGKTLAQHIASGKTPLKTLAKSLAQVCGAVHYAHEAGVIHRDIKPANIVIDKSGNPFVTDFGLAKSSVARTRLTMSGVVVGTPSYMSPEQARGDVRLIGPASDVYSLGATLYEVLTGKVPFEGSAIGDVLFKVVNREPAPPSALNRDAPAPLAAICKKAMDKEVAFRYRSAKEMGEDLSRYLEGKPVRAGRRVLLTAALRQVFKHRVAAMIVAGAIVVVALLGATLSAVKARARKAEDARTTAAQQTRVKELLQKALEGDFSAWKTESETLTAEFPADERIHLISALYACAEKRAQEAEAHFKRAIELKPDYIEGIFQYAAWLSREGRHREAVGKFEAALEIQAAHTASVIGYVEAVMAHVSALTAAEEKKRLLAKALACLDSTQGKESPDEKEKVSQLRLSVCMALGETAETEAELLPLVARANLPRLRLRLAHIRLAAGRACAAWDAVKDEDKETRNQPDFLLLVARMAQMMGVPDMAEELVAEVIKARGEDFDSLMVKACALRDQGKLKSSLTCFKAVEAQNSKRPELYLERALTHEIVFRPKEALADYDNAASLMGTPSLALRFHRARVCAVLGLAERAEDDAMAIYEADPEMLICNPFNVFGNAIPFKRAISVVEKSLASDEKSKELLIRAGDLARLAGLEFPNKTARAHYEKAAALDPKDPAIPLRMALLALSEGDEPRLLENLRTACVVSGSIIEDATFYLARLFFYARPRIYRRSVNEETGAEHTIIEDEDVGAKPSLPTNQPQALKPFAVALRAAIALKEGSSREQQAAQPLLELAEARAANPALPSPLLVLFQKNAGAKELVNNMIGKEKSEFASFTQTYNVCPAMFIFRFSYEARLAFLEATGMHAGGDAFMASTNSPDWREQEEYSSPLYDTYSLAVKEGIESFRYLRGVVALNRGWWQKATEDLRLAFDNGRQAELVSWPVGSGCTPFIVPLEPLKAAYSLSVALYRAGRWKELLGLLNGLERQTAGILPPTITRQYGASSYYESWGTETTRFASNELTWMEEFKLLKGLVLQESGRLEEAMLEYDKFVDKAGVPLQLRRRAVLCKAAALLELGRVDDVVALKTRNVESQDLGRWSQTAWFSTNLRMLAAMAQVKAGRQELAAQELPKELDFCPDLHPWFSKESMTQLFEQLKKP